MTSLSTLVLGSQTESSGTVLDPLPTFGVWTNYQNNQRTYGVYDSYASLITSGYYTTDTEQWNNWASYTRTDSNVSTNSSTYLSQGCNTTQSEGHYFINLPGLGGAYSAVMRGSWTPDNIWPFFGTVIGPKGIRQRISPYSAGNEVALYEFGSPTSISRVNIVSLNLINSSGEPSSGNNGMISYNARTGTLAVIRGDSSNNYRLHVWKNPNIDLNSRTLPTDTLWKFMSEARNGVNGASYFYNDFSWSQTNSANFNESRYHFRVIVGDNDAIGLVRMTPSNQSTHAYIVPNPAGTSLIINPTTVSNLNLTTSYGIDQGNRFGMRSTNTWDNRTIACYCPYYYYASGINMHFVDTQDPSKGFYWADSDTNWGRGVAPIGAGEIAVRPANFNVDSAQGFYLQIFSPSGGFENGRQANNSNTVISNGQSLSPNGTYLNVDTGYTSTDYPHIVPMSTWTKVG